MRKLLSFLLSYLLIFGALALPAKAQTSFTAGGNITSTNAACIATACVPLTLPTSAASLTVSVTGTFSATLAPEESNDNGITWVSAGTAISATGVTSFSVAGFSNFRVRASAFVSGNAGINILASTAPASSSSSNGGTVILSASAAVANATYVTTSDVLWAQYTSQNIFASGADVQSTVRILKADGTVTNVTWETNPCTSTVSGGVGTGQFSPVNGWIIGFTSYIITSGFPQSSVLVNQYLLTSMPAGGGTTSCVGSLVKANIGTMITSAVTGSSLPVAYPGINQNSWTTAPYTFTAALGSPSAGADFSTAISSAGRVCFNGASFTFTTSATAGNRVVSLRTVIGSAQLYWVATIPQGPSTTVLYSFAPGAVPQQQTLGGVVIQSVPFANGPPVCTNSGVSATVGSFTGNIQAGDQFASINIMEGLLNDNN